MPCATGTRAAIEAGKDYYLTQHARERSDPVRALWRALVDRVYRTARGFSGLGSAEKCYFAVRSLDEEVHNGGFHQYFLNGSSDYYEHAVAGLEAMEAAASLDLLLRAKQMIFGFGEVPADISKRHQSLLLISDSTTNRLNQLDRLFWNDPDGLLGRANAFLRKNGLVPYDA